MELSLFTSASTGMQALVWSPPLEGDDGRAILYLHGAGGFSTGFEGLYQYPDFPSLLRDGLRLPCKVIIPSCHIGDMWDPNIISSFLEDLERNHGAQIKGYDLIGYSRGGVGVYLFSAKESG